MDLPVSPDGSVIYVVDDKEKFYCIWNPFRIFKWESLKSN